MGKNPFKISLKWLILFLLLAFIGWQLYKPKPEPPLPISIYDQGYKLVPVMGPEFNRKGFFVIKVPDTVPFYWYKNEFELGDRVDSDSCGSGKTAYPWKILIHKDDLIKIGGVKKKGDKIGLEGFEYFSFN